MAEAMASGVPVVATATEGAREIVEDGVTGTITPIGDPEAMAAAIVSLLRDDERRAAFGKQAAARARERFALDRMAQETERVYLEALGSSRYGGGNSR
jgi:glycosyltransferase involved in cell wall biosynthesis